MQTSKLNLIHRLKEIAATLASVSDQQTLSDSIGQMIDKIVQVRYIGLYLLEQESGVLRMLLAKGFTKKEQALAEASAFERHPGWVFKNKKMLLVNDTENHTEGISKDSKRSFVVRSRVWLPIIYKGEAVGSFGLASIKPNQFNEEHIAILKFLCEIAGVVYNNIQMKENQRKQNVLLSTFKSEYELLFNTLPDSIIILNQDKIFDVNHSFLSFFNFKDKAHFISNYDIETIIPDFQKIRHQFAQKDKNKILNIQNIKLSFKEKKFDAELNLSEVKINGIPMIQLSIRDISNRIQIEQRLIKEKQGSMLYRNFQNVPGILFKLEISNNTPIIRFINGSLLLKISNFVNAKTNFFDFDVIHEDDKEFFEALFERMILNQGNIATDFRIRTNEQIFWLRINATASLNSNGIQSVDGYIQDITEFNINQISTIENQLQFKTVFNKAPLGIIVLDKNKNIVNWNSRLNEILGWNKTNFIGDSVFKIARDPESIHKLNSACQTILQPDFDAILNEKDELVIYRKTKDKSNKLIWLTFSKMQLINEIYLIGFVRDYTKINQYQNEIHQALEEKNILLKEIHHRVKNNMQVISSLLSLQSSLEQNKGAESYFTSCQYRIKAMGIIHEMLYQSENLSVIDMEQYFNKLIPLIVDGYNKKNKAINIEISCHGITLDLDTSIPLGLIVNELTTNTMKFAFKGKEEGSILLKLIKTEKNFHLIFKDDGIGYDIEDVNNQSLGLLLIKNLSYQINGKSYNRSGIHGTTYDIHFNQNLVNAG